MPRLSPVEYASCGRHSSNVPPVPLQGGVDANGNPSVYDGSREMMLKLRYNFE